MFLYFGGGAVNQERDLAKTKSLHGGSPYEICELPNDLSLGPQVVWCSYGHPFSQVCELDGKPNLEGMGRVRVLHIG